MKSLRSLCLYYTTEGLKTHRFQHLMGVFSRYWISCFDSCFFKESGKLSRFEFHGFRYLITGNKIHIFDENRKFICSHNLNEVRGSFNQLPEHRKAEGGNYIEVMETLRKKWNCYDFQHFVNGIKKENPRYVADQLRAIDKFLTEQAPTKTFVAMVMKECCEHYRYRFSQFQAVYEAMKSETASKGEESASYPHAGVEYKGMDVYTKAFQDRVVKAEVETA